MWRSRLSGKNTNKSSVFGRWSSAKTTPANSSGQAGTEKEMAKVAGILGKKVGMTQLFDSKGDVRPATVLQAGPCVVTQHKLQTKDGYDSAQIGLVEFVKDSRLTKPMRGHLAKNNLPPVKFVREVPIEVEEKAQSDGAVK